jgi:Dynamin GTPase effector domain
VWRRGEDRGKGVGGSRGERYDDKGRGRAFLYYTNGKGSTAYSQTTLLSYPLTSTSPYDPCYCREGIIGELMKETEEVASRRKACKEMKELLQRALEILNEVSTAYVRAARTLECKYVLYSKR